MMPLRALPAYLINGMTVAAGIGVVHALGAQVGNPQLAQLALSGAVCASLADLPNPPHRTAYRVGAAALLGVLGASMVGLLTPHPVALGFGIAAVAFVAMMAMAWGPRAGPVAFAPILSIVFSMAAPPQPGTLLVSAAWHGAGAAAYLVWALACSALLQRRYRLLMGAEAVDAAAGLLRSRAALLSSVAGPLPVLQRQAMRGWVQAEAALAERLQQARDFAFAHAGRTPRDAALLLRTIELRDELLTSRLDIDRLGHDNASRWLLCCVAPRRCCRSRQFSLRALSRLKAGRWLRWPRSGMAIHPCSGTRCAPHWHWAAPISSPVPCRGRRTRTGSC